jgi:hypothetical protein
MIHPILTIVFDAFLIGSTLTIILGIVAEARFNRGPAVGGARRHHPAARRPRHTVHLPGRRVAQRRGVMVRSA